MTSPTPRPITTGDRRADRFLERALIANFVIHAAAMLAMALLLAPMLPGGGEPDPIVRIAEIAAHPWRFRAGWLPWQLCALVDLWLALALVRARWIAKGPAVAVLVLTLAAIGPDQYAQAMWITRGIELAQAATNAADLARYLDFEARIFTLTAAWGAVLYTLAAIGWSVCFALARTWSRTLTGLSVAVWAVMLFVTTVLFLPPAVRPSPEIVAIGNALGFTLLQVWLALVAEAVLRRSRPLQAHGRDAPWKHPWQNPVGRALDGLANSRLAGAFLEPLPAFAMVSDITDVVYVNYLVSAERLSALVPHGLELQRLGPAGQYALFTFLTYKHGHFGFRLLGPLRRLMPSPVHTNWRIHVLDPRTGTRGIFFVTNAITSTPQALGARLLTEGMPMHVLDRGEVRRDADGTLHLTLDPGSGSAPDLQARLTKAAEPAFEGIWKACFASFRDFLAYCVPQDRAMSTQVSAGTVTRQGIDLGIPLESCEPLAGEVSSRAAAALVGDAKPLCFRVPSVFFRFEVEAKDPLPG
jgi:hypothetical protein